jgi:hypothetical protein
MKGSNLDFDDDDDFTDKKICHTIWYSVFVG